MFSLSTLIIKRSQQCWWALGFAAVAIATPWAQAAPNQNALMQLASINALALKHSEASPLPISKAAYTAAYSSAYPQAESQAHTDWPAVLRLGIACSFDTHVSESCKNGLPALPAVRNAFKPENMMEVTRFGANPQALIDAYDRAVISTQSRTLQAHSQTIAVPLPPASPDAPEQKTALASAPSTTHWSLFMLAGAALAGLAGVLIYQWHKPRAQQISATSATQTPETPPPTPQELTARAQLAALRRWADELNRAQSSIQRFLLRHPMVRDHEQSTHTALGTHYHCLTLYQTAVAGGLKRAVTAIEAREGNPFVFEARPSYDSAWAELGAVLSCCTFIEAWLGIRGLHRTELAHWAHMAGPAALGVYQHYQLHGAHTDFLTLPAPELNEPPAPIVASDADAHASAAILNRVMAEQLRAVSHNAA